MISSIQTFLLSLIWICVFIASASVHADLDPVSPLLRGRATSPTLDTLDNSRFTVKPSGRTPRSQEPTPPSIAKPPPVPKDPVKPVQLKAEVAAPAQPPPALTPAAADDLDLKDSEPATTAVKDVPTAPAVVVTPALAAAPAAAPEQKNGNETAEISQEDTDFLKRMRALILGMNDQELEALKRRKEKISDAENSVEISLAPAYFYYDSSSAYSVRRYSSSAPGYGIGLTLWISPYFGIDGDTQSTLGASITSLSDDTASALTLNKSRIGIVFRNIDIKNPLTPQTLWKISYVDSKASTSSETGGRASTSSMGAQLAFEAKLPSSLSYAHVIGVSIDPKLEHKEKSGAQGIRSGKSNTSTAIGATLGGEIKFNRKNQVFWTLQHRYEKNLFKGEATLADPQNGITPNGLAVDQSLTLFSIGYRWGK